MRKLLAIALLLPSGADGFIELFDIGLANPQNHRLTLLVEFNGGRRIDMWLDPHRSLLMRRGFGEHITKISVISAGHTTHTFDLDQLRSQTSKKRRSNEWLYIDGTRTRIISSEEKERLMPRQGPNQVLQPTPPRLVFLLFMISSPYSVYQPRSRRRG